LHAKNDETEKKDSVSVVFIIGIRIDNDTFWPSPSPADR
jgi:hypothetical protein